MGKKAPNWPEIKARYLAGERPHDIAKDYRSCTASAISSKATRQGWTQERDEIRESVAPVVAETLAREMAETGIQVSKRLRANAIKAAEIETELLESQLLFVRRGKAFFDFLDDTIRTYAITEEPNDPVMASAIVKELSNAYDTIVSRLIPQKLVVAAFQSARAEADLVADEEHERENPQRQKNKTDGMNFILNIKRQSEIEAEALPEDTD